MFFCDLPDAEERRESLDIYARKYDIHLPTEIETHINLDLWTGAELKQLCIEIAFHPSGNMIEAAQMIKSLYKPLANTEVKTLREWALTSQVPPSSTIPHTPRARIIPWTANDRPSPQ